MKKKGASKNKSLKQKNKSIVTSQEVTAKDEVESKPEVNLERIEVTELDATALKREPLIVLEDKLVYEKVRRLVEIEEEKKMVERIIVNDVVSKIIARTIEWKDIANQTEIISEILSGLNRVSTLLTILKGLEDDRTYKNPMNGFRMPLDERLSKLAGEFYEYLFGIYLDERKLFESKKTAFETNLSASLN